MLSSRRTQIFLSFSCLLFHAKAFNNCNLFKRQLATGNENGINRCRYFHLDSTNNNNITPENDTKRAGTSGYSILRQPLKENWDTEVVPSFKPPKSLNQEEDDELQRKLDLSSWWGTGSTKDIETQKTKSSVVTESKKESKKEDLDLFQRTLETLDYPFVLNALADLCLTTPAREIVLREMMPETLSNKKNKKATKSRKSDDDIIDMPLSAKSVEGVHSRYNSIKEMKQISTLMSSSFSEQKKKKRLKIMSLKLPDLTKGDTSLDLQPIWDIVDQNLVLGGPEILEVSTALDVLYQIEKWREALLIFNEEVKRDEEGTQKEEVFQFKELLKLTSQLQVDSELYEILSNAFDETGNLSGKTFPVIGEKRAQIRMLKRSILADLDNLLDSNEGSSSLRNRLALESGGSIYSEINGRVVIPIEGGGSTASSLGIVHDTSRSGKTLFIEPTEIVGPTNELRQLEVELQREEAQIWRELTSNIFDQQDEIKTGVQVAAQLDLVLARIKIGDQLALTMGNEGNVVLPEVKDEGVISLRDAKHPVLLLRELDNVIGSDVELGNNGNQGLILTGPNSGGKTIIMKLLGLMAFMARDGIPLPAAAATDDYIPRVDFFNPVLADIGDLQSVDGDLSTFSGHMLVCREVLASSGENTLVLMDEIGSGTDPAQGVAIAQSLLEALVDVGARVAITTHYLELKQLASSDTRFSVAGMEFVNNRPTYRLIPGQIGESFALSVAERLNLPPYVIERATELLDQETRQMGDLIRDLEVQKNEMENRLKEIESKKKEMEQMEVEMKKAQEKLAEEQLYARRDEASRFAKALEEKEEKIEAVLDRLKSDPSRKIVAKSWDDIRFIKRDALTEADDLTGLGDKSMLQKVLDANKQDAQLIPLSDMTPPPSLKVGDTLIVCKKGSMKGKQVNIVQLGGKQMQVSVNGMPVRMKLTELALPNGPTAPEKTKDKYAGSGLSKAAKRALAGEEAAMAADSKSNKNNLNTQKKQLSIRTESNTLDLRGSNFEEGRRKCENFFSKNLMSNREVVYVLHGHGTGVLKQKLREWFKRDREWVQSYRAADKDDGGDAFTRVQLKKVKF